MTNNEQEGVGLIDDLMLSENRRRRPFIVDVPYPLPWSLMTSEGLATKLTCTSNSTFVTPIKPRKCKKMTVEAEFKGNHKPPKTNGTKSPLVLLRTPSLFNEQFIGQQAMHVMRFPQKV